MPTDLTSPAGVPKWEDFDTIETPQEPQAGVPKWEDFDTIEPPQEPQAGAPQWEDFEPAEPVKVLPPYESAPGKRPTEPQESGFAFKASPYRQAPAPLPSELPPPEPEKLKTKAENMASIMATWGQEGRPRHPTRQDVEDTVDILRQGKIGLQQAPFQLSASAQNTLAWTSELFAQAALSRHGAWASVSEEQRQKNFEFWQNAAQWFREAGEIPQSYVDALDVIGEATPGPREVRKIAASAGSAVPSVAVAPLGFPAMIAMAGLQSAGDVSAEALEKRMANGEDRETALRNSTADGLIGGLVTALTAAGFGRTGKEVLTAVRGNPQAKGAVVRFFKEAGFEAGEEAVDQTLQAIREKMTYRPELTMEEAAKEVLMAFAGGFAIGGGVAGTIETAGAISRTETEKKGLRGIQRQIANMIENGLEPEMRPVAVRRPGGEGRVDVPVQPDPVRGRTRETLPTVAGIRGAQVVDQALSVGLTQTAQALATDEVVEARAFQGTPAAAPPVDLTPGQVAPDITPGAPASPVSTPVAQSSPTAGAVPAAPVAPRTAQGVPGVSPGPTRSSIAPGPIPGPRPAPRPAPAPTPTTPPTQESIGVQTTIAQSFPSLTDAVEIVNDGTQFPAAVLDELKAKKMDPDKLDGFFHNGRVILNAKRFPVGDQAKVIDKVIHEAAVHLGLRKVLGNERFGTLSQEVYNGLTANERALVAKRNKIDPTDTRQIGEEWLAYEAERVAREGQTNTLWTKIANGIRRALRRMGVSVRFTDVEIAQLINKGLEAAQNQGITPTEASRLSSEPVYGPGNPLATVDTIRFSYADVQQAKLGGEREYTKEIIDAGMEGSYAGVKRMLEIEAAALSDLIPPSMPFHQPKQGQSLIEYVRRFYSPEGIALLNRALQGSTPPPWVEDKANWYLIKRELDAVKKEEGGAASGLGRNFLAINRKTGGVSWDFGLGTCMPTENCSVCYAKGVSNIMATTKARARHSIVAAINPEGVGTMVARYIRTQPKRDLAFLRVNGAGDTTFEWQARAINTAIRNLDRPVHIFSRSHTSRAPGTVGLDSISNGQFDPGNIENGVTVYKMGSIDRQLVEEYGYDFLRENLERRGILNSYLVKDTSDIPVLQELHRQGVFVILHVNATKGVVRALRDAGILSTTANMDRRTGLAMAACPCALKVGPFFNGCATCLVGGGPCFAIGSQLAMSEYGQFVPISKLLSGETEIPPGRLVEMSRIGVPANKTKMQAEVAARAYEMAANDLESKLVAAKRTGKTVTVENPRDRTGILKAETEEEQETAREYVRNWRELAATLRGLDEKYKDSSGFNRYLVEAEIDELLSQDIARTENIGAMDRTLTRYSVDQDPPPARGDVRLYRGQEQRGTAAGNWWTRSLRKAASFAAGGQVFSVDVPTEAFDEGKKAAEQQGQGGDTVFLRKDADKKAKPVNADVPVVDLDDPDVTRFSVSETMPKAISDVVAMSPTEFAKAAKTMEGGLTGEAIRAGREVTEQADIDQLQVFAAEATAKSKEAMGAGDFDVAMAAATQSQFFREAYETATNTGSMAHAKQQGRMDQVAPALQHPVPDEGPPPGSTAADKLLPPKPGVRLPKHDDDYLTRYSISDLPDPYSPVPGTPIKNESMERALAEAGQPPLHVVLGKPDEQLMRDVQRRMALENGWVDSIIKREQKKAGLLTDEEVLALSIWMQQLRTEIHANSRKAQAAEEAGLPEDAIIPRKNVEFWSTALEELAVITKRSGTESARAFRARQLAANWDFTFESMATKMRQAKNWAPLTDKERQDLIAKAEFYQNLTRDLMAENEKLRQEDVQEELRKVREEVAAIHPEVWEVARERVADSNKRAKSALDRLRVKWKREFPDSPLRASVSEGAKPTLSDDLMRELAIIGADQMVMNVTDQVEWEKAMTKKVGPQIQPYLTEIRAAADAQFAQDQATWRAAHQARRAPRRAPGTPKKPKEEPTVEERIEVTKAKIHQVAVHRKTTTEPVKTAEDELYYPVQALVRELVEQDPFIQREELIDAVHEILLEDFPDMSRDEAADAISGRGRVRRPDPETVARTIRELKAQIRIFSNIEGLRTGKGTKETGYQPDKPSDEVRRLTQQLEREKKKHPELTSNRQAQLTSYLESRKTWYRNRIADLLHEIRERELIAPPVDAETRTDPELEALKAEYAKVREEHAEIFLSRDLTDEQRLEMAEKAAERMILKMEEDLANGRRTNAGKRNRQVSAKLEALRARIIQLKAEQEWAQREINAPPDLKKPEDFRRWFQLDREIRKIQQQLAEKSPFSPRKKIRAEDTPTNQRLAEQLEMLRQERQAMREAMGPGKPDPITQAINTRIAQLRRQIADYEQRRADRDYEPRRRKEAPREVTQNDEVVKLSAERERVKMDFFNDVNRARWKAMGPRKKIMKGIATGRDALTNLRSSFDISGSRQAFLALISMATRVPQSPIRIPKTMLKVYGKMFQAMWDPKRADAINEAIRMSANWQSGAYKAMGIEFTDIEATTFNMREENARSLFDELAKAPFRTGNRAKTIITAVPRLVPKGVAASNRAFSTFLNLTRAVLADELLAVNFNDRAPTAGDLEALGHYVNVATGRGSVNPSRAAGYANFLWAPKLLMSRIQFLTLEPLWGGGKISESLRARKIIAKEYGRILPSWLLLYMVGSMFYDEKDERSPTSSDFGKQVRGNTRLDIWGGFQQPVVLFSRFITGKSTSLRGREIDILKGDERGQGGLAQVVWRFMRSKARPDVGVAINLATRRDFLGRPLTVGGVAEDLFVPLPFTDIVKVMKDRGFTEGMILEVFNQLGAGVNVYDEVVDGKDIYSPREVRSK